MALNLKRMVKAAFSKPIFLKITVEGYAPGRDSFFVNRSTVGLLTNQFPATANYGTIEEKR